MNSYSTKLGHKKGNRKINNQLTIYYRSLLCSQNLVQRHVHIVICHYFCTEHYLRTAGNLYHPVKRLSAITSKSVLTEHLVSQPVQLQGKKTNKSTSASFVPDFDSFCSEHKLQYICNQQERVQRNSQNHHACGIV